MSRASCNSKSLPPPKRGPDATSLRWSGGRWGRSGHRRCIVRHCRPRSFRTLRSRRIRVAKAGSEQQVAEEQDESSDGQDRKNTPGAVVAANIVAGRAAVRVTLVGHLYPPRVLGAERYRELRSSEHRLRLLPRESRACLKWRGESQEKNAMAK